MSLVTPIIRLGPTILEFKVSVLHFCVRFIQLKLQAFSHISILVAFCDVHLVRKESISGKSLHVEDTTTCDDVCDAVMGQISYAASQ